MGRQWMRLDEIKAEFDHPSRADEPSKHKPNPLMEALRAMAGSNPKPSGPVDLEELRSAIERLQAEKG